MCDQRTYLPISDMGRCVSKNFAWEGAGVPDDDREDVVEEPEGRFPQQLLGEGRLLHKRSKALLSCFDDRSIHRHIWRSESFKVLQKFKQRSENMPIWQNIGSTCQIPIEIPMEIPIEIPIEIPMEIPMEIPPSSICHTRGWQTVSMAALFTTQNPHCCCWKISAILTNTLQILANILQILENSYKL